MTNAYGLLRSDAMRAQCVTLLKRLNLNVDPDVRISELKVGQQQVVEIAKAISLNAEVIIMDEPTSAISESEVEILFGIINELRSDNKTIVYISHKLDELFRIADRYVVLRDGCTIESGDKTGMTFNNLVHKMVGREIQRVGKTTTAVSSEPVLVVSHLSLLDANTNRPILKDISFKLGKGEVVGLFGLMGAGRTELMETLFGLRGKQSSGRITIEGDEVVIKSPIDAIRAGLALVPEDRKKDGLVLQTSVSFNLSLTTLNELQTGGLVSEARESALVTKYVDELGIKASSQSQLAGTLSGGNQQKVVLAKWLATKPRILLLDEPTRGIDINAKNEIYKLILQLADQGLGIVLVSSELPEILAVSDRILVMADGEITGEFDAGNASESLILAKAIPKTI